MTPLMWLQDDSFMRILEAGRGSVAATLKVHAVNASARTGVAAYLAKTAGLWEK